MTLATFINVTKYWRSICIDSIGYIWGAYWNNISGNYEVAKSDTPMGSSFTVKYTTANTILKIIATSNDHIFILCQDGAKLRKWDGYTFDTFTAENAVAICRDNAGANYINTSTEIKKCVSGGTSYSAYIASCPTGFIDINAALTMYLATAAYGQKGIYKCAVDETEFTDISAGALDWNQILASRDGRKYAGIDSDQHLYRALAGSDTFAESLDTGSAGFYLCDDANGNIFAAIYDGVIKAIKYGVTYYGNGNTGGSAPVDANTYLAGSNATVAAAGTLVKAGSTFSHWNTAADGSGTSYNPADLYAMTTDDVALYAIWVIEEYSVTYDANTGTGGSVPTDATVHHYEDPVTVKYNSGYLSKAGYSFDHWNTAANDSGTDYNGGDSFNMPAANVTLYAQYVATTGEYPRLKTAATAVGLWTPTTGGTDAKTYYDAAEALRTTLYGADGLTGILSPAYIESTYEFATDDDRDAFLKLWSDYDDAARHLQDAITSARETVSMTSTTAPTGLYTGQLGQYLGKRYRWSGAAWVSIDMAEPKPWASHDLAGLPEYPDDPAGTTYKNPDGWTTGVDGWVVGGGLTGTMSIVDGHLNLALSPDKNTYYFYNGSKSPVGFVCVKVKYDALITTIKCRNTSTYVDLPKIHVGDYYIASGYVDTNPTYISLRISFSDHPGSAQIKDIYVGTGATLTPPIDNSGNGHHLTANALIPVVDATAPGGRYVKLSGQPAYMSGTLSGFTAAIHLSFPFYLPAASTTAKVVAESSVDYTGQNGAWALIWNFSGTSGRLALVMRTASGEYLGGYCTPTALTWYYGAIQYNQADAAATALGLYLNGALQSLTSLYTGATRPAVYNGVHWFGARAGSSMFCDMMIGSPIVILDYIPTQEENNWLAAGKPLNQKYSIADYRLYESAADGKITPQEKRTYWMPWAREKWDAVDVTATTPALASPSGLTVAGEYKTLVDAALAAGITVANATLVAYRTAWENCRAYFYATPFVLLSTYWDSTITVTTSTLMGYKSAYNAAADNLRALIASTRASTAQTNAIAAIPTNAPRYWGRYLDSAPTANATGDCYTRYSETSGVAYRGVFYWNGSAWTRTEDRKYIMQALQDISFIIAYKNAAGVAIYGTAADYTSDSTTQADFAFFQIAMVGYLEANEITFTRSVSSKQRYSPTAGDALISMGFDPRIPEWSAGSVVVAGYTVHGMTAGGVNNYYVVSTAGTTGSSSPTWPTSGTVEDGTAVWTYVSAEEFQFALATYLGASHGNEVWMKHFVSKMMANGMVGLYLAGGLLSCGKVLSHVGEMPRYTTSIGAHTISGIVRGGADRLIVHGSAGVLKYSDDFGKTWTDAGTNPVSGTGIYNVAWLEEFEIYIGSTATTIVTSPDGDTWTSRYTALAGTAKFAESASLIVAIDGDCNAHYSSDGVNWSAGDEDILNTYAFGDIKYFAGNFVICGGNGQYATSSDGDTWTSGTIGYSGYWAYFDEHQGRLYTMDSGGHLGVSEDGTNWDTQEIFADARYMTRVTQANGRLYACGYAGAYAYSVDGDTWTVPATSPFGSTTVYGITEIETSLYAHGYLKSFKSADGLTWEELVNPGEISTPIKPVYIPEENAIIFSGNVSGTTGTVIYLASAEAGAGIIAEEYSSGISVRKYGNGDIEMWGRASVTLTAQYYNTVSVTLPYSFRDIGKVALTVTPETAGGDDQWVGSHGGDIIAANTLMYWMLTENLIQVNATFYFNWWCKGKLA